MLDWNKYGFDSEGMFQRSRSAHELHGDYLEEIFEDPKVLFRYISHFLKTGRQSIADTDGWVRCVYRGNDNNKCAVGCVLADDIYSHNFENLGVDGVIKKLGKNAPKYFVKNQNMLMALQRIHDRVDSWDKKDGTFIGGFTLYVLETAIFGVEGAY